MVKHWRSKRGTFQALMNTELFGVAAGAKKYSLGGTGWQIRLMIACFTFTYTLRLS